MSPLPLPLSGRLLPSPPRSFSPHRLPAGFFPTERELVFDIDLTDYDDVRTCGKEGHICCKCWPLMAVAVEVCVWGEGGEEGVAKLPGFSPSHKVKQAAMGCPGMFGAVTQRHPRQHLSFLANCLPRPFPRITWGTQCSHWPSG